MCNFSAGSRHKYGGSVGRFTSLWGFKSLAYIESWEDRFSRMPEERASHAEFMELIVQGSYSTCILEPIKVLNRKARRQRHQEQYFPNRAQRKIKDDKKSELRNMLLIKVVLKLS
jgi:hypothetical protein